jgi:hypothetical protein
MQAGIIRRRVGKIQAKNTRRGIQKREKIRSKCEADAD